MQVVGREGVGEGLRALPVVDAQKGVVGKGETDAGGGELAGRGYTSRIQDCRFDHSTI